MSSNDPIILTNGWRPKRVPEPHYPYVFAVGVLQRIWVAAERDFEALIWHYLGVNSEVGEAITTEIGSRTRGQILKSLATEKERVQSTLEVVRNACVCFDVLRTNRNLLVHSRTGGMNDVGVWSFRVKATGTVTRETLAIRLEHFQNTADQISSFRAHLEELLAHFRTGAPLPSKSPKPSDLLGQIRKDQ